MVRKLKTTKEDFVTKARLKHGDKYSYDDLVWLGSSEKVEVKCNTHGGFWITPHLHHRGTGCQLCSKIKKWDTTLFIEEAKRVHGNRYNYSESICVRPSEKLNIICNDHGVFSQTANAHIRMSQGCPTCGFEITAKRAATKSETSSKMFVSKSKDIHGNKYDYSLVNYTKSCDPVQIICPSHGAFYQTPNNHLRGADCGRCVPGGYSVFDSGYFYILRQGNLTKVGITNKTPEIRLSFINSLGKKDFKVLTSYFNDDGKIVQEIERSMLKYLKELYSNPVENFHGYTECFVDADLNIVLAHLEFLCSQLKEVETS